MDPNTVISLAEISQYLWNAAIPKQNQFFNGTIDPRKPQQLYLAKKALQYGVQQNLSGIPGLTNYVYALCGAQIGVAQQILGTNASGGDVIPGSNASRFSVFEYSNNATEGTFTISFLQAVGKRCINAFRQGNNIGQILTSGIPTGNDVVWNQDNGLLTVAVAFYPNEFVRVIVQE